MYATHQFGRPFVSFDLSVHGDDQNYNEPAATLTGVALGSCVI